MFGNNKLFAPRIKWEVLRTTAEDIREYATDYENAYNNMRELIEAEEDFQQVSWRFLLLEPFVVVVFAQFFSQTIFFTHFKVKLLYCIVLYLLSNLMSFLTATIEVETLSDELPIIEFVDAPMPSYHKFETFAGTIKSKMSTRAICIFFFNIHYEKY